MQFLRTVSLSIDISLDQMKAFVFHFYLADMTLCVTLCRIGVDLQSQLHRAQASTWVVHGDNSPSGECVSAHTLPFSLQELAARQVHMTLKGTQVICC